MKFMNLPRQPLKPAIIQRMLARNRYYITHLQNEIEIYHQAKIIHDADGDVEREYQCHEILKSFRKELANFVVEQKALKQLIKEI